MSRDASPRRIGLGFWFAFWLLLGGMGTWAFDGWLDQRRNPNQQVETRVADGGVQEVVLQRNAAGHFVTAGKINGKAVTFLIDTGASDVSVPEPVADRLGLERGPEQRYRTANGTATGYLTQLQRIGVGGIQLRDVQGSINPATGMSEVLLGMSFLRRIEFTQRGDQLILRQR